MATTGVRTRHRKTTNAAGGTSHSLPDHERLLTGVLTCFFKEPKSYGDTSDDIVKTARKVVRQDPEFVAKLACYARNEFHMRTISQVLAAEVAKGAKGNRIVRRMTRKVIERPDDITNILAYHFDTWGPRKDEKGKSSNPVPRSLRRGIADVFPKFDEYQLAKYKQDDKSVKLKDALLIARPKPSNPDQYAMWKRLIEGQLATPETREAILSEKGQSKEVWEEMIDSGKMGYMAMLRNLNNFCKYGVDDAHMDKVIARISDEKQVAKSKQLPFRFFTAYKMLARDSRSHKRYEDLVGALDTAISHSAKNMPQLPGTTYLVADESGSMSSPISEKSLVTQMEVGNLMMAIADGFCEKSIVAVFGDTTKRVNLSRHKTVLSKMEKITRDGQEVGWSTRLVTSIEDLNKTGTKVDRIIVFSDMQAYEQSLGGGWYGSHGSETEVQHAVARYRRDVNKDVWVHSIDLAGYGTVKTKGEKTNLIAGWSDKVFEFIKLAEDADGTLIDRVRNYRI